MKIPSPLFLYKLPVTGLVPEQSATAPTSPGIGQLWTDTSVTPKIVRVYDGTDWVPVNRYFGTTAGSMAEGNDARIVGAEQTANKNAANGYAGLDAGTKIAYIQIPVAADGASTANNVVSATDLRLSNQRVPTDASVTGGAAGAGVKIAAGTITHDNVATANKDGLAAVPSLRTLGTGAQQAVSGTDARLSDQRTPLDDSVTNAKVATNAAIAESKLNLATDAAAGTGSRRTIGTGALQAMAGNTRLDTIAAPTGSVNLNNQKITGLGAPTVASDAARLADVQASAAGIDAKPSVRVASTGNVASISGLLTLDGITVVAGDRVLLKNQTTASANGVYVAAAGAWARAEDVITPNSVWFVEQGTAQADTAWWVTNDGAITTGTTALNISQFAGPTTYTGTTNRVTVTGTVIDIAGTYVGQTSITTLGAVTTGTWSATDVAVAHGGTGASDAATARTNLNVSQRGYAATLGAVSAGTPLVVTHSLGTQDVIAQVRDTSTNEYVYLDIINASTTTVTVTSGIAYAANALRIVVIPVA